MKHIKIKRLSLKNFKCHRHLELDFNGRNADILGDNATGKTSIYDSLMWLLFSRDSRGNGEKNIEIKPLNADGEVKDHDAITEVEAVLLVNGEEISLRRTLQEVWTTRRGSSEAVYTGNVSEYYINSVPVKKNVFSDKVDEIVNEDTFKLLTNISYFPNDISWQDRRAVLFRIAGVMDDDQVMATNERFKPLAEGMGRLALDDYKKKLLAEKRGFVGAKTEIPARINECQKTIADVQELDFEKAKAEVELLNAKSESLKTELLAIEHDTASEKKRMEIREARLALDTLEAENRQYRANQQANAPDIAGMRSRLTVLQSQYTAKSRSLANDEEYLASLDNNIAAARNRWIEVNGEVFTDNSCPTCGQALPAAKLKVAVDKFEAQKAKRLREIEQTANAQKEAKAATQARIDSVVAELAEIEIEIAKAAGDLSAAENNIIAVVDMQGYAERKKAAEEKIHALEGELADIAQNAAAVKGEIQKQIAAVKAETDKQMEIISKESLLAYSRKRIEELQEDARNTAACLEAIEKMLYLLDEYSRYKTQFVEDSINSLFRIARFRLFREQANGGVEDRCDVVCNGVPYINLNSGAKINVGIDIINTLSTAYGVNVPLFVDNAESVTKLEATTSQIIRLVVSERDKELRVNYEN